MTIHLFIGVISSVLLLTIYAIAKRNMEVAYATRAERKKEEAHIEEELMIHTALEEAGALPAHHAHHHAGLHNKKVSKLNKNFWFYTIGYFFISVELFYLYRIVKSLI
jgi:hypothetical protein